MVQPGGTAPDFIAPAAVDGEGELYKLYEAVDSNDAVVVQFCPASFVPTCTAELSALQTAGWHTETGLELVALSGDSLFSHVAYANQYGLTFPIVSDFHGGVADTYDLLATDWEGHSKIPERATVVVDGEWEVRAVETTADPLDATTPAPATRATQAVKECGIDVDHPDVAYDQFV